jgi:hypothetical protein
MLFVSPVKRARLLAVLLLASLAWGSTVEFTHHHGAKTKSSESLAGATPSLTANAATATWISSSDTNGTSSKSNTGAACLICQLHQNLSATIIGQIPGIALTEALTQHAPPDALVKLSEFRSTGQGRAPPSNL